MSDVVFETYRRQMDVIDPRDIPPITIIGAGASGSCIGIVAAKMGCQNITIYDGDDVELHNIPNQYYPPESIMMNKSEALRREILRFTPDDIKPFVSAHNIFWSEREMITTPYVFVCVDSMDMRRRIFNRLRRNNNVRWLIDTRMGAEYYEVHTVNMNDDEEKKLYEEDLRLEPRDAPCTARSVIYTVMMMASRAVYSFKRLVMNQSVPRIYTEDLAQPLLPPYRAWREEE